MTYSAANIGVTLKTGLWPNLMVIENDADR